MPSRVMITTEQNHDDLVEAAAIMYQHLVRPTDVNQANVWVRAPDDDGLGALFFNSLAVVAMQQFIGTFNTVEVLGEQPVTRDDGSSAMDWYPLDLEVSGSGARSRSKH
jgi:hypothetical protein